MAMLFQMTVPGDTVRPASRKVRPFRASSVTSARWPARTPLIPVSSIRNGELGVGGVGAGQQLAARDVLAHRGQAEHTAA